MDVSGHDGDDGEEEMEPLGFSRFEMEGTGANRVKMQQTSIFLFLMRMFQLDDSIFSLNATSIES